MSNVSTQAIKAPLPFKHIKEVTRFSDNISDVVMGETASLVVSKSNITKWHHQKTSMLGDFGGILQMSEVLRRKLRLVAASGEFALSRHLIKTERIILKKCLNKSRTVFILLFILLASSQLVHAENSTSDLKKLSLEQLMDIEVESVYGASKFEQKVTEAPSSVSIVTADDIKKYGYRTLADILRSVRSFVITSDRNYSYIGVRGFGRTGDYNSRILVLVDGHRINDNIYEQALIGEDFIIDVDLIDRVEVIRGPGSSLYGNNAYLAVISVTTRKASNYGGVEASGAAGY